MEAVPRLSMICCDLKVSPSNTEFGPVLKKYIRDHYHEDPESYSKEIKELETLRQNAIKAPMDFTGCSVLKKYYSQLQKLQSRFPMTDDGAACVPFMWTDIYSGVAYNITDIEYEEACILYNIGALHSKLGTMDSRVNAEGIKIGCTHFQCAAWAFQHLRDTYPQPKGSDMSHDLLTFFINVMLAQAQECILEKSMLDNRKSSITAKIAAQVVDYYKCALGIMVSGSPSTDAGSILDIVGSKVYKGWKRFIEFKMSYYTSISHLYMGNQAEENEKWGERVAWFQSAADHLSEAFKIAKKLDQDDINNALTFTNDVIGGKHSSSKKENDFVYHDKVPALSSLPELKGASLVKGIPFSSSDPEVSGPDIFARLVPMEAHETSSLYSEEKAKILRSVVSKIEGKNEELVAYLSSLQLESSSSFDDEDKVPQELIEKCAALSVRPTAIADLTNLMNELLDVSKDVEISLKSSIALLAEEDQNSLMHQETFGKRGPSNITVDLKKECSKYEEAHKKAIASNNTLQTAVSIHIGNLTKLSAPLDQITEELPSACSLKTPENVKAMDDFNHLISKVEEMRKQRQYLENLLREALLKDDITKRLVTMDKKEDLQNTFAEELKKHNETLTYIDQNLTAQDNILCALTESNARYADTRKALREIKLKREEMVKALVNSYDAYEDLMEKAKKGLEFYKKLQSNVTRLLTRIKSVTKVQDEERIQRAEAELRKGGRAPGLPNLPPQDLQQRPKLKDFLPYLNKNPIGGIGSVPPASFNVYPSLQANSVPNVPYVQEPMRQATLGGPADFDRNLKPSVPDKPRVEGSYDVSSMGVRPTPVGSEQTSVPAMCTTALSNSEAVHASPYASQQWNTSATAVVNSTYNNSQAMYQSPTQNMIQQPPNSNTSYVSQSHFSLNSAATVPKEVTSIPQGYNPGMSMPSTCSSQNFSYASYQQPTSHSTAAFSNIPHSSVGTIPQSSHQAYAGLSGNESFPSSVVSSAGTASSVQNYTLLQGTTYPPGHLDGFSKSTGLPSSSVHPVSLASPASFPMSSSVIPHSIPGTITSLSYPAASVNGATKDRTLNNVGVSALNNSSVSVPGSTYAMPYSNQQAYAASSVSSSGNNGPQNQAYATWQTNQMYMHYSMPSSSYSALSPDQYYQNSGAPAQAKQACVTASIDTKTNTLNSLNPYAVANSSNMHPQQNMYMTNDCMNNSTLKLAATSINSTGVQSQTGVPHATVLGYSGVPCTQNQTGIYHGSMYDQASVPLGTFQGHSSVSAVFHSKSDIPSVSVQGQSGISPVSVQGRSGISPSSMQGQFGVSPGSVQAQSNFPSNSGQYESGNPSGTMQSHSAISQNQTQTGNSSVDAFQHDAGFDTKKSNVGNATPETMQGQTGTNYALQSNYSLYHPASANGSMYNTVPSYSYTGSSMYTHSYYNSYPSSNQVLPNSTQMGNVPIASTAQNYSNIQSNRPVTGSTSTQHTNYSAPYQQYNQTVISTTDSLSSIPAVYESNSSISDQQLQAPMKPKPLAPTPSTVVKSNQVSSEPTIGSLSSDSGSASTEIESDVKRDFITPPPNSDETDKSKKDISQGLQVLQPKVIDLKSIVELKEKELTSVPKDPLDDLSVRTKFVSEVEKYEKFVDGLVRKSLNGTTPLDQKWKEFTDVQDKESRKRSISVARCCPLKNRFPDVMPYDCNRVKLTAAKDDYINASYLKDICPNSAMFVITQAPLPATFNDFWMMVYEQQVETLVCLLSDMELKNHVYFPKEKGQVLIYGSYEISLHSYKEKNGFVERMINLTHVKNRTSRVVVHLQFTEWPSSGVPVSPATLLQFITDVLSYYKQQRNLMRPIVVHCSAGIGRSGCFCLITAMVSEMNCGHGPRDVTQVAAAISHQRKFLIQDKDQLKFCYDSVLYYAQDLLMRRGILTTRASFDDKLPGSTSTSSHVRHPSEDFILGGGLAKLQSGIAKLGLSSDSSETKAPEPEVKINTATSDAPSLIDSGDTITHDATYCDKEPKEIAKLEADSVETTDISKSRKGSSDKPVSSITSLLDPSNFTLDATSSPAKRKITKDNFAMSKGSLSNSSSDCADPLSQLDPLWSLKK